METDFEKEDWAKGWRRTGRATMTIVGPGSEGFKEHSGKALRVHIPKGSFYGTDLALFLKDHLPEEPEEVYLRYYLRFCEDWETRSSGKLPGFGGTYGKSGWGGKPSDGTTGWSARGLFIGRKDSRGVPIGHYVYHAEMKGQYGDNWLWDGARTGVVKPGEWVKIEQAIRLNHPDKANGELTAWVNDRRVMRKTGIRFRKNGELKVECVWMNIYHGGKTPAPKDLYVEFDDILIRTGGRP